MGRSALNSIQDFGHGPGFLLFFINEWNQDHVDVIGHHDGCEQVVSSALVMQAGSHDDLASCPRKLPALERAECHKVRLVMVLEVRKASSVERHSASSLRSCAPLGRPRAAVPTWATPP